MNRAADHRNHRDSRAITAIIFAASLCALLLSWNALAKTQTRWSDAKSASESARSEAERIGLLRARSTRITDHAPPEPDLVARLHAALEAAGADRDQLSSISTSQPEALRTGGGQGPDGGYRRVTAPLVIDGLRPAQLARLVVNLADNEPAWTLTGLSLTHAASGRGTIGPDDLYTARLTLENVHVDARATPSQERTP